MLEVRILGELAVVRDGRALPLPASKKTRALLGFLAATGEAHLRERLCELLWDGPEDPRAQLRWSLSKLRPLVDDEKGQRLCADRERVSFAPLGAVVDLHDIGGAGTSLALLRQSAARFRGELLEGIDLPDCYRFQAWLTERRESVRALRAGILAALVAGLRDAPEEALQHARARVSIDPLSEAAHAQVIRCLGALDRNREAIRQYDEARRLLSEELGTRDLAELERARHELLHRAERPVAAPEIVTPPPAAPTAPARSAPLVGRAGERAQIVQLVESAQAGARPPVLLLSGESGIGKSRLLTEVGACMRAAGGRVLGGRSFEAEMVRPYGPLIDALAALDPAEVPAALRADLAPLFPKSASPTGERERLFDATVALLRDLSSAGRPLALILDDVHWLDETSAALLHFIARSELLGHVLIACGARPGELADHRAVLKVVRALDRDLRLRRIELGPLDAAATAELVRDLGGDAARTFQESGGHPLFALELARARARGEDARSLDGLIADRLDRLSERTIAVLPLAAALGRSFGAETLAASSGLPPAELMVAVDELERHGILRSGGASWDFSHDLFRQVAYRQVSEPRRRLLHLQIAQALARLPHPDRALAGELLHHATLGGDFQLAARACLIAGEHCLQIAAPAEAEKAAMRGVQLLDRVPLAIRLDLEVPLLAVAVYAHAERRELDSLISRAILTAQAAGHREHVSTGFQLLAMLSWREENIGRAEETTLRSAEAAQATDPITQAQMLGTSSRCLALIEREMPRAAKMAFEASAVAERHGLEVPEVLWALGMIYHFRGDLDRATEAHRAAVRINETRKDHWAHCMGIIDMSMIELERGRPAEARRLARDVIPLAEKLGAGSEEPIARCLEALADYAEDLPQAAAQLQAALRRLEDIDAKTPSSYALNVAAELDLAAGRVPEARQHAERALAAATAVGRQSEIACARALLLAAALGAGKPAEARRLGRLLADEPHDQSVVGVRAFRLVNRSLEMLKRRS